jgi:hypothetical protein
MIKRAILLLITLQSFFTFAQATFFYEYGQIEYETTTVIRNSLQAVCDAQPFNGNVGSNVSGDIGPGGQLYITLFSASGPVRTWSQVESTLATANFFVQCYKPYLTNMLQRFRKFAECPNGQRPTDPNECYTCTQGQASSLGSSSTIQSINQFNQIIPASVVPNPQCNEGCVVQHTTGGPSGTVICAGFILPGLRTVGSPVHSICSSGVTQTGVSCNQPASDVQGITDYQALPFGYVDANSGAGDGNGDGNNGDGLSTQDSAAIRSTATNTANISSGIDNTNSLLTNIGTSLGNADTNAQTRHNQTIDKLDAMLGKLGEISTNTKGGANGFDVTGTITGGDSIGAIPIDIEHPANGLQAPGESHTGISNLLNTSGIVRPQGTCPVWTLDLPYMNASWLIDGHCTLFNTGNVAAIIGAMMTVIWGFVAFRIAMSA